MSCNGVIKASSSVNEVGRPVTSGRLTFVLP